VNLLTNWDDLIHGTAVFSAAVPFLVALIAGLKLPCRFWWLATAAALLVPLLWLFRFPALPPASSEDIALSGLAAAIVVGFAFRFHTSVPHIARFVLFALIAWLVYPAWLADDGGLARKLSVTLGMAAFITAFSGTAEYTSRKFSLAAYIPPAIALAVLLQLGGSLRFGQASGAIAAALGALCILLLWKKTDPSGIATTHGLAVSLLALLAWSGWLFAEIRWALAAALFFAPLLSLLASKLPIPCRTPFQKMFRDGIASALIAIPVAAIAIAAYLADSAESEGY
jgi:hypothetical protein